MPAVMDSSFHCETPNSLFQLSRWDDTFKANWRTKDDDGVVLTDIECFGTYEYKRDTEIIYTITHMGMMENVKDARILKTPIVLRCYRNPYLDDAKMTLTTVSYDLDDMAPAFVTTLIDSRAIEERNVGVRTKKEHRKTHT